jgi:predicted phosphoadenosine phosphosulfate sulfurtransferase
MKKKIKDYVSTWEKRCYSEGIPEEVPSRISQLNKAPSYKDIVRTILKNDGTLKTLGFTPDKPKVYHEFKRVELAQRPGTKQLKLFN